jgi:hypothetical protein
MSQRLFNVTPEFKEAVVEILQQKKFSAVFPYMNLINRETFTYEEQEINSIIALLSEFSYSEVAEFFATIKHHVSEIEPGAEGKEETL